MGQKVSPIGMRVGVIRDWESKWFAEKDYADLLLEDVKIREFVDKELKAAAVARVEIQRVKNHVNISLFTATPGVIVGVNGETVTNLTKKLTKLCGGKEIKLNVVELANPDLSAVLVARNIASQLEARASFRTVQKKAIQRTMRSGAKGIKTMVSGRLGGADIARSEGYSEGIVPLHTLRSDIDYAWVEAHTTYGRLGVKVWICRGEVLNGETVKDPEAPKFAPRDNRNRRPKNDRRNNNRNNAKTSNAEQGGN
ncbi:MAG: 30S ribosomal protein S3 [Erysipelotrichaceae bacterium]